MASMRDIQRRRASVQSTGQITKAMKLVATVKLQKARGRAESTKPYFDNMYAIITEVLKRSGNITHRYLKNTSGLKKAVIVITSNRGLAGGYNSNIVKLITGSGTLTPDNTVLYTIGTKGRDALARRGYNVAKDYSDVIEEPGYRDAMDICGEVMDAYTKGEIGEIYIAYTVFKNTVSHIPTLIRLLPVDMGGESAGQDEDEEKAKALMNYEPCEEEVLDIIIPKYVSSIIYGALMEAVASENGARMSAMDSATSNAEDMIADLSLKYNRARQGSITQELTEIIAGAEAIG